MNLLVLVVVSTQILYYLLMAQIAFTTISALHPLALYALGLGGILGSIFSASWNHDASKTELIYIFSGEIILSSFYPDLSFGTIFFLGLLLGYVMPILIYSFSNQSKKLLALSVVLALGFGLLLFTNVDAERSFLGVILPLGSLVALYYSKNSLEEYYQDEKIKRLLLIAMMFVVIADTLLYKLLNALPGVNVWDRYQWIILAFYVFGGYLAYWFPKKILFKIIITGFTFAIASIALWYKQPLISVSIYSLGVGFYYVTFFFYLAERQNIRIIGILLLWIGWGALIGANVIPSNFMFLSLGVILGSLLMLYPLREKN